LRRNAPSGKFPHVTLYFGVDFLMIVRPAKWCVTLSLTHPTLIAELVNPLPTFGGKLSSTGWEEILDRPRGLNQNGQNFRIFRMEGELILEIL
jgi:hypothetical protein